jgi:hypothetical protein
MKTILSAIIALSVLTGFAATASAFDPNSPGVNWSTGQGGGN